MNPRSFLLAPLALFAALSAAAQNGPAGKLPVLDDLLPVARTNAVAIFGVAESNLWFWSVDCHYQSEGFADDSTNALQWITFSFFDPHSAERVPRGGRSESTAMAYHVRLLPDGTLKNSSSGRTIGWRPP